ncbi:MAG: EamA family transporter, partial [Arthrobacter sp.]|nr:EamA family transporter [Arthrobacter sp.]
LFGWGLARIRASTATGISLLETVVAAGLAVLVVGERLPPHGWLGAAVVLFSLFVLTPGRSARGPLRSPSSPGKKLAQQQAGAQPHE